MTRIASTVLAQRLAGQIHDALSERAYLLALDPGAETAVEVAGTSRVDALLTEFDREWREAKR